MRWWLLALAGCGRVGFDPLGGPDASAIGDTAAPPDAACTFGAFGPPQRDAALQSAATDWGVSLSHDQLTLSFASNRSGGSDELFQATRATVGAPWSQPAALGLAHTATMDDPSLASSGLAIYWGESGAIRLATRPSIASAWIDQGTVLVTNADHTVDGGPDISADELSLVFTGTEQATGVQHLYLAQRASTAEAFGSAAPLPGISDPAAYGSLRGDLLEAVWQTPGGDLVHATRASTSDPFGPGVALSEVNSTSPEGDADLSDDGTTLWFASDRAGGAGSYDLYVATRSCQ